MINQKELEESVLSGILRHGEDALIDVEDIISSDSFTGLINQILYKVSSDILKDGKLIDYPTLLGFSKKIGLEDSIKENRDYINRLFGEPVGLDNVRQNSKSLMKLHLIRKLKEKHKESYQKLEKLTGEEKVDDILSVSESAIFDSVDETLGSNQPEQIAEDWETYIQDKIESDRDMVGLPTPFKTYNTLIGGGLRNGVTLVAARPKTGKSTFAKEVGIYLVDQDIPVLYLDTEMDKYEQLDRCISGLSQIDLTEVEAGTFRGDESKIISIKKACKDLSSKPYYHRGVYGKDFQEILAIIRRWLLKRVGFNEDGGLNPCLVIYDYFKLMSSEKLDVMQETQALGFQISELAAFCKEYQFPCLSFVQINRDGIDKESSNVIAQSDRLLWLCVSASIFKRKTKEEIAETGEHGNMKLIPIEARFGPALSEGDYINLVFDKAKSTITEGKTYYETVKTEEYDPEWIN